jgi:hypothetical protein
LLVCVIPLERIAEFVDEPLNGVLDVEPRSCRGPQVVIDAAGGSVRNFV